jgi:hypothetical protein
MAAPMLLPSVAVQLAGRQEAPHRCLGGRAGAPHRWQCLGQPTKKGPLVDLPVGLDEVLRDQQQLCGVIRGRAAGPVPSCR